MSLAVLRITALDVSIKGLDPRYCRTPESSFLTFGRTNADLSSGGNCMLRLHSKVTTALAVSPRAIQGILIKSNFAESFSVW